MNKERWQQVEEIFNVVVDLPSVERESYLEKYCGEDSALREQVERLLKADEVAEGFIESPVPMSHITRLFDTTVIESEPEAVSGLVIGQYKLVREIGRGGMGTVFLAERADKEFYQRVAIKLIKRGMDTDFILRRFRNERQILANLNHPNIARLLDGGTTQDGLPYFVMEYIDGKPITKYCDAKRLTLDERLQLFRQVCAAIEHAHQNSVIHRDIKPGNILVTDSGVLKLLDFGIAKILNPELAHDTIEPTATAVRMMTPEYASPEQVRGGKITPASDQYSLGVLLYELITGHRPYRLKNHLPHEIARVICEEDPDRPSTAISRIEEIAGSNKQPELLTPELVCRNRNTTPETLRRAISKGLDDIVMQALNKDLHKRYVSVEELSEDIGRYLNDQTIRAARYTPVTDSSKVFEEVAAVKEQNSIAILPLKILRLSNIEDTDGGNFLGVGIADALITRLSNIKSLTVRPTASVMKFSSDNADALSAGKELRVNYVLDGRMVQAGERIRLTVQLINIKTQSPQWAAQFDENLMDILALQDALSEQVAHEIIKNLSGAELEQLAKRGTDNAEANEKYLRGRFHWHSYTEDGLAKAIKYFYEAIAIDPNFAAAYSGVADYHTWLGMISILQPSECFLAAKEAATKALELDAKLAEAHASLALVTWAYDWDVEKSAKYFKRAIQLNKNYTQAHEWYTHFLAAQGRFDEALREMKHALDIDPQSPQLHLMMGSTLHNARRFEEGARYVERAAELEPDNYLTLQAFGWLYPPIGRAKEALAPCRKALELSSNSPVAMLSLAHLLLKLGEREEAEELLGRMHKLEETRFVSACNFAIFYAELGDKDRAFEYLNKMVDQREYWSQWLRVAPRFDPLRDDPRFAEVLKRVAPLEKDTGEVKVSGTQIIEAEEITDDGGAVDTAEQVVPFIESKKEEPTRVPFYRRFTLPEWMVVVLSVVALILIIMHIYQQFRTPLQIGKAQRLTNNQANDSYPKVSPDGKKVLFISARDGNSEVYVMDIDGSNVKRLTFNSTFEGYADWFYDGSKILVESVSTISGAKNNLFIMNSDGSNQMKIPNFEMHTSRSSISPDGKQVAFASSHEAKGPYDFNIWAVNVDGTNLRKLTDYYEFDSDPVWSPDGKQIAFIRATEPGAFDIMLMNADGTNQRNITNTPEVQETIPAWSRDGKQFAFARSLYDTRNNQEIWIMNIDGSNKRQITNSPNADTDPSWLPEGKRLVFQSRRDGNDEIYLINIDDNEVGNTVNNENRQKTIAILPFKTDGNDETEKALSIGLPEALGVKLSQVKQLSVKRVVIVNNLVLQEQKGKADIEYVVSGELKRAGNNLQINARMTQTTDNKILWAETFDQPLTDIATLQSAIADRILQALTIQLTDREAEQFRKRYTNNNEAYQLYLAGRYHLGKRTQEGFKNAIINFEKAVKLDSNFALAYAGLADSYALLNLYPPAPTDAFNRAKEYATKALSLDDTLAEPHASLAFVKFYSERDWDTAEKEFRRSIELNSSYVAAHHWFALMLSASGRHDEALSEIKKAEEIDASSLTIKLAYGNMLIYARRYDEAAQQYQNVIIRDEGSLYAYTGLRRSYQLKGLYDEANATLIKERAFLGDDEFHYFLSQAEVEASAGKTEEAQASLKKALALPNSAERQRSMVFTIAVIYSLLNDKENAFKLLFQAAAEKRTELTALKVHPQLDNLRSDSRFAELLRREKLSE